MMLAHIRVFCLHHFHQMSKTIKPKSKATNPKSKPKPKGKKAPLVRRYDADEDGYAIIVFPEDEIPITIDLEKNVDGVDLRALVRYQRKFFSVTQSEILLKKLCAYGDHGLHDGGNMYGVEWESERKTIQVGDIGVSVYKYKGSSATETIRFENYPAIKYIRQIVYDRTGIWCNFCLYNHYTTRAKLGWHSDNEKNMVPRSPIVSFSFGFRRRFRVRETTAHEILFDDHLDSGSILVMDEDCQALTEHCIMELTKKETDALDENEENIRINLTLRQMICM